MTNWEIGQDLIKISDLIGETRHDFVNSGKREISDELKIIQAKVGDLFNRYNDHDGMGILDSSDLEATK